MIFKFTIKVGRILLVKATVEQRKLAHFPAIKAAKDTYQIVIVVYIIIITTDESIFWTYFEVKLQRSIIVSVVIISISKKYASAIIGNRVSNAQKEKTW